MTESGWTAHRDDAVPEDVERLLSAAILVFGVAANYARTRHFYEKMGFLPLEETELWGERTPCLIMVKALV